MKLRGCPDSSAPAPSSSSSILWPTGAPGGLERGERRPSEKVSSRNRGAPEGAHLGGSRAQAEAPGGPVQPSSPSPQGHAARGAPGLRQAPSRRESRFPQGPWGPLGQPAGSPSLCSGFFASRLGSGRPIRRYLRRSCPERGREKGGGGRGSGEGRPLFPRRNWSRI
ncbi:hypothetical protein HJG60_011843 [Phyllostomus discolor]|uniref:Uncharacterized protein n=1 Tax=Phyllostomus discolor TaxID=89673 RepID=A0A833ZNS6_9CHIR|nr:hypothetical protein HJG60_011843 [Phyllostomus discolor]